jgi:hypothetical protein
MNGTTELRPTTKEDMANEVWMDGKLVGYVGYDGMQYDPDGTERGILTFKNDGEEGYEQDVKDNWSWWTEKEAQEAMQK